MMQEQAKQKLLDMASKALLYDPQIGELYGQTKIA